MKFEIKNPPLPKELLKYADRINKHHTAEGNAALLWLQNEMKKVTPVATGRTRNAWQVEPMRKWGKRLIGSVVNSTLAANVLQKGSKPHFPMEKDSDGEWIPKPGLRMWFMRRRRNPLSDHKDINRAGLAYARKLTQKGHKRKRIFSKKFKQAKIKINARFAKVHGEILRAGIRAGII